jgi:NADPH-dependent 2,4-dienoyl-CoA reductase/sulfur reductase-like enzyme
MRKIDLVIIGGGPAGLAAAVSAKQNGIEDILVVERDHALGGILNQCIHNGFGLHMFKEQLTGPEYAERYIDKLNKLNIDYVLNTMVLSISKDKEIVLLSRERGYEKIEAKAVILAMGCRERPRGALNIPGTRPAGVYTAGTAQRYINMEGFMVGKKVVILGSGDIGLIMARRLTLEGADVSCVFELMPYSGGLKRNIVQCLDDFEIPLKLSHTIFEIVGKDRVEGVYAGEVDENFNPIESTRKFYPCDTVLFSVGLIPENELSKTCEINLDKRTKGPYVNGKMQTNIDGVFACGNVVHVHDLVDYVSEESERAGYYASKYILDKIDLKAEKIEIKAEKDVSYTVPQWIDKNSSEEIPLRFRVRRVFKEAKIILKTGDEVLKVINKKHLAPGEMETVKINNELISKIKNILSVSIEEVL